MRQCQGCTNNQEQELPEDEIDDSGSEQEDDEYLKINSKFENIIWILFNFTGTEPTNWLG